MRMGERFGYGGTEWVLLDRQEDRHLCCTAEPICARQFDPGVQARFEKSKLHDWLQGEWFEGLIGNGGKETDFCSVLMNLSISFHMLQGDCVRVQHAGLLSWHQWLRYDERIPRVWKWQWTCTISDGIRGHGLRCVGGKPQSYGYYLPHDPTVMVRPVVSLRGYAEAEKV